MTTTEDPHTYLARECSNQECPHVERLVRCPRYLNRSCPAGQCDHGDRGEACPTVI